jgi:hypothetical protein
MGSSTNAIEEARLAGIDIDLIDTNLALPVRERWAQHEAALELACMLAEAKRTHDAALQHPAPATH